MVEYEKKVTSTILTIGNRVYNKAKDWKSKVYDKTNHVNHFLIYIAIFYENKTKNYIKYLQS